MALVEEIINDHKTAGYFISIDKVKTFILEYGKGPNVLCLHGVPTSSFLYRKVLKELAGKGFRGISVDLPGLGLSDRPSDFDYSFSGLANFLIKVVNQLELKKFHLVVHDIGGPIGFALASEMKSKIASLTILNTWIDVESFTKPLPMLPLEKPILGEVELALITHLTWYAAFSTMGVSDMKDIQKEEVYAYVDLLKREDNGKAFLKIMRSYDYSKEFKLKCYAAVQNTSYPIQIIWGEKDPGLRMDKYGKQIQEVAGVKEIIKLDSGHLLQEDQWKVIAERITLQAEKIV